jgi:hypothetical protein
VQADGRGDPRAAPEDCRFAGEARRRPPATEGPPERAAEPARPLAAVVHPATTLLARHQLALMPRPVGPLPGPVRLSLAGVPPRPTAPPSRSNGNPSRIVSVYTGPRSRIRRTRYPPTGWGVSSRSAASWWATIAARTCASLYSRTLRQTACGIVSVVTFAPLTDSRGHHPPGVPVTNSISLCHLNFPHRLHC